MPGDAHKISVLGFTAFQGSVREGQLDCDAVGQGQGEDVQICQEVCQSVSLRLEEGIHDFKGHHMSAKSIVNYSSACSKLLERCRTLSFPKPQTCLCAAGLLQESQVLPW